MNTYNDSDCKTLIGSHSAPSGCQSETINGIYGNLTIAGCTYANFMADYTNNLNAVEDAIATSLSNLNVIIDNLDVDNNPYSSSSEPVQLSSFIKSYTSSASELNYALTTAVSTGEFTKNLQAAAKSNNATELENASSSDITITNLSPITTSTLFGCTNPTPTPTPVTPVPTPVPTPPVPTPLPGEPTFLPTASPVYVTINSCDDPLTLVGYPIEVCVISDISSSMKYYCINNAPYATFFSSTDCTGSSQMQLLPNATDW